MKRPGEDGYDFPCGDSHSKIDSIYKMGNEVWFHNNNVGCLSRKIERKEVEEFRNKLREELRLCDNWLQDNK